MTSETALNSAEIKDLLLELGSRLCQRGIEARVFLVGGAAIALAYNTRRVTKDLGAVFEPKIEIYQEAERLGSDKNLPPDWLNDAVKGLLPDLRQPDEGTASFSGPGIHVGVASAEYLFAMKALAARQETDGKDIQLLAKELGITTLEQALNLVERYYSRARIKPVTQFLLEDLFGES